MSAWLPLMDYAMRTGVSLSTLRRHIKSNKLEHRVENGRYLVRFDGSEDFVSEPSEVAEPVISTANEAHLERELQRAREEIAELKMLVALYEEQMAPRRRDN